MILWACKCKIVQKIGGVMTEKVAAFLLFFGVIRDTEN